MAVMPDFSGRVWVVAREHLRNPDNPSGLEIETYGIQIGDTVSILGSSYGSAQTLGLPSEKVRVEDLWEVFPELRTHHDPRRFADTLVEAARFSREHRAFHDLRDKFNGNALSTALDEFGSVLKLEDETEEETDVD